VPVSAFSEDKFENGHAFDGSSIAGWKGIQASDMLLMPDPDTAYIDPFFDETTVVLTCDVVDPPMAVVMTATRAPSPSALKPT
jgi:glutamine synthetase